VKQLQGLQGSCCVSLTTPLFKKYYVVLLSIIL